ncbi:MAG: hypothetical protein CVU71_10240 [Deltaproteobacteria bacterium HGW-Deltaproteobacteria-6]|jgi:type II secretion system protein I|nr:MAG: hypothetical protein CVU71_10240 [Deltaproteobacteria bacterium HGW-Deltaproteobacteria-6]
MMKRMGAKGFTLLEILVALAVLAIAVTMVIQLFSANLKTAAVSRDMTQAVARADTRIKNILSNGALTERTWTENTEDGYRFDVSISEILKDRTDNLPVKLMEVMLTTRWVSGMKEKKFSLKSVKMVEKISETENKPAL